MSEARQNSKLRMKRKAFGIQYIIIGAAALLTFIAVGVVGGAMFLLDFALTPESRGKNEDASWQFMYERYEGMKAWHDSLTACHALRDTFVCASDDTVRLHAYYVKAARPTRRTAVLVHGYTDNAVRIMMLGRMYERNLGMNILVPDLRFAGQSGGSHIQMGWFDRHDVHRWIDVVPTLFGDSATIVVHGISMGAATTMMLSGDTLPSRVRTFVEDCGYTSVWEQFSKELKEQFGLPAFPLLHTASALCQWRHGWNFGEASSLEQVKKCRLPMLFIHGSDDKFVPTEMVHTLHRAKPGAKDLWIAPKSLHAMSYHDHPQEYTERIRAWVDRYL